MSERRYNEEEVAAIFERAAEAQHTTQRQLPSPEGMTLAQLQEIGREVGIAPDQLAQAAKAVELGERPMSRTFLGLPIGVGLSVDLDRKLTDEEWDRFVVDLRDTFDARGKLRQDGAFRQWSNGNLQAHLEPTATGHRIRIRTIKSDARGMLFVGLGMLGFSVVSAVGAATGGGFDDRGMVTALVVLTIAGVGMLGSLLRLPSWARLRRRQMEELAARISDQTNARSAPDL